MTAGTPYDDRSYSRSYGRTWPESVLASLALHAVFGILLLFLVEIPEFKPAPQQSIQVEILMVPRAPSPPSRPSAPSPGPGLLPQSAPENRAAIPPSPTTPAARHDDTAVMVKPSHMLSAAILSDPRSWKARMMLARVSQNDRLGQLCSLEAMAQVAAWKKAFKPDLVVAYAMADTRLSGNTLLADGAALHSNDEWFNLKFKCGLTPDHKKVASFEFRVGSTIPHNAWESHNLPSRVEPLD